VNLSYVALLVAVLIFIENLSLFSFTGLYIVPPVVAFSIAASPFLVLRFKVNDVTQALLQFLGWVFLVGIIWVFVDLLFANVTGVKKLIQFE